MTFEQSPSPDSAAEANPEKDAEETDSPRHAGAIYASGRALARVIYRPHVEGRSKVPTEGPVIFASNHLSFIDSIAIPVAAPRPVHFLAKSTYFEGTGVRGT